jgi:hypothetical protein
MADSLYLFEERHGIPFPVLAMMPGRAKIVPDGKRYFDLDGAAGRFGRPREVLIADWHAVWGSVSDEPSGPVLVDEPVTPTAKAYRDRRHKVLRQTKFGHLSDDFWDLLLADCDRRRLSVEHVAARVEEPYRRGEKAELKIITTLQAFRLIADRTGQRDGEGRPLWAAADGNWKEVWPSTTEPPHVAVWEVRRRGCSTPFAAQAYWEFHHQLYQDAQGTWKLDPFWARGAAQMLAKCALALSYKAAWPADTCCGGLFTSDEIRADGRSKFARDHRRASTDGDGDGVQDGNGAPGFTAPPEASLLVDDPKIGWGLVDDTTPDSESGLIRDLLAYTSANRAQCVALIAMFREKLPRLARGPFVIFAAVVLRELRDRPAAYGLAV